MGSIVAKDVPGNIMVSGKPSKAHGWNLKECVEEGGF